MSVSGYHGMVEHFGYSWQDKNQARETLYLPSGQGLDLISFGYKNTLSHYLWFKTINYFGKHYRTDRNYQWLNHQCDLVTTLDKRADYAFNFCVMMLSWEADQPEKALEILNKWISYVPDDWHPYYLRGFVFLFFFQEYEKAKADFSVAAQNPNAPDLIARLAKKNASEYATPKTVIPILQRLLKETTDPTARDAFLKKLHKLTQQPSP